VATRLGMAVRFLHPSEGAVLPFFTEGGGYKVDPRRGLVRRGLALEAKPGAAGAKAPNTAWLRVGGGKC
jgi:hypothetical protein